MGIGQVRIPFLPELKLRLSSPSHKAWSTGSANKWWGSRWVRTGPLSPIEELGSVGLAAVWSQGMPLLRAVLATQTKLRGPSSLPSSSAFPCCSHALSQWGMCNEWGHVEVTAETLSLFSSFCHVYHRLSGSASLGLYLVSLFRVIAVVAKTKRVISKLGA